MITNKAIIVCAPSGAGKTTIVQSLIEAFSNVFSFSVSATTRTKRGEEINGKDYFFISESDFSDKLAHGEFVEHQNNYGKLYGTLVSEIERIHKEGKIPLFDVDVRGAVNLKKYFGDNGLVVFIEPPSLDALEKRLRHRGTETETTIAKRLSYAKEELEYKKFADAVVVNDKLTQAVDDAKKVVASFLGIESS